MAVSNTSIKRAFGYRRSSAGVPDRPHASSSMCPTYSVENRLIIPLLERRPG